MSEHTKLPPIFQPYTKGTWAYDGEDMDSCAAHLVAEEEGLEHNGYELFSVDENDEVNEPIGSVLEEDDVIAIVTAVNFYEFNKSLIAELTNALSMAIQEIHNLENAPVGLVKIWEDVLAKAGQS